MDYELLLEVGDAIQVGSCRVTVLEISEGQVQLHVLDDNDQAYLLPAGFQSFDEVSRLLTDE